MVKMKYDISVCGILRALYLVPIFRSVALSTNLFFVLGTVRVNTGSGFRFGVPVRSFQLHVFVMCHEFL